MARTLLILTTLALLAGSAAAGVITGTVIDPQGHRVAGADIFLVGGDHGGHRPITHTNDHGEFAIRHVQGRFAVRATFGDMVARRDAIVRPDQVVTLRLVLGQHDGGGESDRPGDGSGESDRPGDGHGESDRPGDDHGESDRPGDRPIDRERRPDRPMMLSPNPFNSMVTVTMTLPEAGPLTLQVFNLQGREVATLVRDTLPAGTHRFTWNGHGDAGRAAPSGVYFVQAAMPGSLHALQKVVLVR